MRRDTSGFADAFIRFFSSGDGGVCHLLPMTHRHTGEQTNRSKSAVRSSGPNGSRDEKMTTPPVRRCPARCSGSTTVARCAARPPEALPSSSRTGRRPGGRFSSMSAIAAPAGAEQVRRPGLEGDHPPVAGQPRAGTPRVGASGDHRGGLGGRVIKRDVGARHGALNGECHDAPIGIQVRCERTQPGASSTGESQLTQTVVPAVRSRR